VISKYDMFIHWQQMCSFGKLLKTIQYLAYFLGKVLVSKVLKLLVLNFC